MAVMKSIAIAAEHQQELSGSGFAFRQGLLFAIGQMAEQVQYRLHQEPMGEEAFDLYAELTEWLFDMEDHLERADRGGRD